jgi:PAS domain S-box-containing protein
VAVREAEQVDYRELVERVGDMIYTLDVAGRFKYINSAGLRVLGYEREEILGRHFQDVLEPDSARVAREHFERGLEGSESTPFFEVQAISKGGKRIDLEIRAGSLYRDGELIGRQGVARDISELKRLQAEVADKSERLALLEDQARIAMDLYRRIADITLSAPTDPAGSERALRSVQSSLAMATADKLGLAARDVEVIELLARGCSNAEIGQRIHLSPNTVKDRVSKLMRILGARSRTEVVARAAGHGLIGDAPLNGGRPAPR